ncbi:MAG TPA: septum formation initiator family protein [bacterium]|nr:septum formation initiator family protein [bacterium]
MKYNYHGGHTIWERSRRSKFLVVALILVFIFMVRTVVKEKKNQNKTTGNINALEQEIAKLQGQNSDLSSLIEYLRSDEFVDREAREKLNMQKPDEKVVLIPEIKKNGGQVAGAVAVTEKPNWQLWQEYFFGEK